MRIRAELDRSVVVPATEQIWVPSPTAGVERRLLDRIGGEVARATSIVRYAPGSAFPAHVHDGGEEYLVLEGVFQDEAGDHPVGRYVRNPPTSRHTPASAPGCTIFVKLHQFDPEDRSAVDVQAPVPEGTLFRDAHEHVAIRRARAGEPVTVGDDGGEEILVLAGTLRLGVQVLGPWSWVRLAPGDRRRARADDAGPARFWSKRGHLVRPRGLGLGG